MKTFTLVSVLAFCTAAFSQSQPPAVIPNTDFTADYPTDRAGIFLKTSSWPEINNEMPAKTKTKRGIAASLSYGAVPAKVVSEYEGDHASTQLSEGQVVICICHLISIPAEPVIVRLHPKKGARELDGGKMIVYPVVGGSKTADANRSDLIPVDVAHPDPHVWLVRTQAALPAGEYALMLGTQNVNIYPFTVIASAAPAVASTDKKP